MVDWPELAPLPTQTFSKGVLGTNIRGNLFVEGNKVSIKPGDNVEVEFGITGDIPLAQVDSAFGRVDTVHARLGFELAPDRIGGIKGILRGRVSS